MKCTFCRLAMPEMHTLIYCLLIDWRAGEIQALVSKSTGVWKPIRKVKLDARAKNNNLR